MEKPSQLMYNNAMKSGENAKLTTKQKKFCEYYATDQDCFGNGVQAYVRAYDLDENDSSQYKTAKANAHKLLGKEHILNEINSLLESEYLNDQFISKQYAFLITQNQNLSVKRQALNDFVQVREKLLEKRLDDEYSDTALTGLEYVTNESLQDDEKAVYHFKEYHYRYNIRRTAIISGEYKLTPEQQERLNEGDIIG